MSPKKPYFVCYVFKINVNSNLYKYIAIETRSGGEKRVEAEHQKIMEEKKHHEKLNHPGVKTNWKRSGERRII